jgi:ribose 5-phosphate isomerase A
MTQDELKQLVGREAVKHVVPGAVLGVGTGSTVNCFIEALAASGIAVAAAVSSSEASTRLLLAKGIKVVDLNDVAEIPVYIDGADEIDGSGAMIKGGGGALTREKVVAAVARQFVCIADESKCVSVLGKFPLPVEVLPMAREQVRRALTALGGPGCEVKLRAKNGETFVTDNGNIILDVHGLSIAQPRELETQINQITGVVTNGLFALRGADIALISSANQIKTLRY